MSVILLTGCDGGIQRCEIEGSVTIDGQPVKEGSITFQPLAGTSGPISGASVINGHYKIEKVKGPLLANIRLILQDASRPVVKSQPKLPEKKSKPKKRKISFRENMDFLMTRCQKFLKSTRNRSKRPLPPIKM